jgi:uncharacterized SAM-binding protein YcdF (DUF218 family)
MSSKYAGIHRPPEVIVVLGGGGMPSESGLMRTWYAARTGNHYNGSKIIIALPGDTTDSTSSVRQMKDELILRGIASGRISFEAVGTNTRAQALNILSIEDPASSIEHPASRIEHPASSIQHRASSIQHPAPSIQHPASSIQNSVPSILIVTSPEHLYRAVLSFRKAGFKKVDGLPAFENTIESDLSFDDSSLGGKKWIPGIGKNLTVRYEFWRQMRYEELILREWMAIVYYKVKGWI